MNFERNRERIMGNWMKTAGLAAALAMTGALAACGGEADAPAEAQEGQISGMTIENPRMVLNAVEGNPAAVYLTLKYDGDRGLTLRKVDVEGASSAVMHEYGEYNFRVQMMEALPVALTNGSVVEFEPGGLHIMAMDPSATLQPGGKAKVTLTVSGGQTQVFEADILSATDERAGEPMDNGTFPDGMES